MTGQIDREGRYAPEIPPLVAQAKVVGNCLPVPQHACKPQPPLRRGHARQPPVMRSRGGITKQARMRCRRTPAAVLLEEFLQVRLHGFAIAQVQYLKLTFAAEEILVSHEALFSRYCHSSLPPGQVERRDRQAFFLKTIESESACRLFQMRARRRLVGN